ncbi:MAG TPA: thiamine pyrophosphate-dependent enzyme [Candidatus Polarisedimenticolaceae bacterium]
MSDSGFLKPDAALPYCKGCGHAHVLRAIDAALDALELPARDLCVVTDIGCVGLADAQIDRPHTVHTTHGRSTAFATGIALADAVLGAGRLKTLVMIGDGGSMIGLNHLVFAASINADVTVVVHNNFLFGMTGGQHSAFSPMGFVTATTREGNRVPPLDLGALLAAARAPFVARAFATDGELPSILRRAIAHPGFAVVEVLELCTAHGSRRNPLGASRMKEIVAEAGYALGVLRDEERPHPLERAAEESAEEGGAPAAVATFTAKLDRRYGVVLAGTAGERVQSAATSLAKAALACGLHVSQKNDNPITQGSGFSLSELILSPHPIDYTGIETPDAVLVASDDGARELARSGTFSRCGEGTLVLADEGVALPNVAGDVRRAPLRAGAGAKGAAAAAVLWWVELTGAIDRAAVRG